MSQTYYLHCEKCKTLIWIGQGHAPNFVVYGAREYTVQQGKFLREHYEHPLIVSDIDYRDKDGYGYEWKEFPCEESDMNNYKTTTVTIPRASWSPLAKESPAGSRRSAVFTCPTCGEEEALYNHDILSSGQVIPAVVCSHRCGFHADVVLEGWE